MKKSVILTASSTGAIFTKSLKSDGSPKLDKNGKEFGYIRVENPSTIDLQFAYANGGVKRGNSALIAMTVEAWERSGAAYKVGMEIPGNVRVIESLTKEHNGFQPKLAGEGGVPCLSNGQQIYRSTEFDATGSKEDSLIAHDNVIVGSNAASKQDALNK